MDFANKLDQAMGDVLIIYGGTKKIGWDDGVMGADIDANGKETQYILTRFFGTDISTPSALTTSLRYAEEYRKSAGLSVAKEYLILRNHGGAYSEFGHNEITGNMLSVSQLQNGIAAAGTTYDVDPLWCISHGLA